MDCLLCVRRCFGLSGKTFSVGREQIVPTVVLDTSTMGLFTCTSFTLNLTWLIDLFWFISGNDVVIVKNGHRICGTGAAISTVPIVQNKAYFEAKVQQTGNECKSWQHNLCDCVCLGFNFSLCWVIYEALFLFELMPFCLLWFWLINAFRNVLLLVIVISAIIVFLLSNRLSIIRKRKET